MAGGQGYRRAWDGRLDGRENRYGGDDRSFENEQYYGGQAGRYGEGRDIAYQPRDSSYRNTPQAAYQSGARAFNGIQARRTNNTRGRDARRRRPSPRDRSTVQSRDSFKPPPMHEDDQIEEALDLAFEVFTPGLSDNWRRVKTDLAPQQQDKVYALVKHLGAALDKVMYDRYNANFSINVQDNMKLVDETIDNRGFLLVQDCEPARSKDTNPAQLGYSTSWLSSKMDKPRPMFPLSRTAHTVSGKWLSTNDEKGPVYLDEKYQERFMPMEDHPRDAPPDFNIYRIFTTGFGTKASSHIGLDMVTVDLATPMKKHCGHMDEDSVEILKQLSTELYVKDMAEHRDRIGLKAVDEEAIKRRIESTREEEARKAGKKNGESSSGEEQSSADDVFSHGEPKKRKYESLQTVSHGGNMKTESAMESPSTEVDSGQAPYAEQGPHLPRSARSTGSPDSQLLLTPSSTHQVLSSPAPSRSPASSYPAHSPSSTQPAYGAPQPSAFPDPVDPRNNALQTPGRRIQRPGHSASSSPDTEGSDDLFWAQVLKEPKAARGADGRNRGNRQVRGTETYVNAQPNAQHKAQFNTQPNVLHGSNTYSPGIAGTTTVAAQALDSLDIQDGTLPRLPATGQPAEKRGHEAAFGSDPKDGNGNGDKRARQN